MKTKHTGSMKKPKTVNINKAVNKVIDVVATANRAITVGQALSRNLGR